mmetsp:Transcript_20409/g.17727  ORF Transcript_20409/g.17727 Transcript_20409/m.17727 type:complete len:217 (-) Transcript_20409:1308-1958(-)
MIVTNHKDSLLLIVPLSITVSTNNLTIKISGEEGSGKGAINHHDQSSDSQEEREIVLINTVKGLISIHFLDILILIVFRIQEVLFLFFHFVDIFRELDVLHVVSGKLDFILTITFLLFFFFFCTGFLGLFGNDFKFFAFFLCFGKSLFLGLLSLLLFDSFLLLFKFFLDLISQFVIVSADFIGQNWRSGNEDTMKTNGSFNIISTEPGVSKDTLML